jgi:hypothetical protein
MQKEHENMLADYERIISEVPKENRLEFQKYTKEYREQMEKAAKVELRDRCSEKFDPDIYKQAVTIVEQEIAAIGDSRQKQERKVKEKSAIHCK